MSDERTAIIKDFLTKSRAVSVIGVVLAVNFLFLCLNPFSRPTADKLPADHSWIYWTTRDYVRQPSSPDVVFLGSSLFLHPLAMLDSKHLNQTVDYVDHHHTVYAEDRIADKLGISKPQCFTFAMPGSLVSDDWIIFKTLMRGERKPKVLVLGLSMRDLIDNKVHCVGTTPTFKYLSKLIAMEPLLDIALPEPRDRTDYVLGKIAYLWGNKPNVQAILSDAARNFIDPSMRTVCSGKTFNNEEKEKLLTMNINAQLERGWMVEKPDKDREFNDNTEEYAARYHTRNEKIFSTEKEFFKRLMDSAKSSGVQVVVINMPLTNLNVKLIPPGVYDEYRQYVERVTKEHGFIYRDFYGDPRFTSNVFYDTAHMNAEGGKRLVDGIVDTLSADKVCSTNLRSGHHTGIAGSGKPL